MPILERVDFSPEWNQLCPEWYTDPAAEKPRRRWEFSAPFHEVACGEKAVITAKLFDGDRIVGGEQAKWLIQRDFHDDIIRHFETSTDGVRLEISLDRPGFARISASAADGTAGAYGIGFSVRRIEAAPEIEGFDAYWERQLARLRTIPPRVLCHDRVAYPEHHLRYAGVVSYDLQVECVDGVPVSGILCLPENAAPESCPAYLFVHGAGVRPAFPPLPWAKKGFLALNISALGIRNFESQDYYNAKRKEWLDYSATRSAKPEMLPFNGMALRVIRALQYLKSRPEWDGRTLIIHGGSQGGWQALVGCAFDPAITFAQVEAPAMCNLAGALEGRTASWPMTIRRDSEPDSPETRAALLFDGASFARRGRAKAVFTVGYSDAAAVPSSVFAAYHAYGGADKTIWSFPDLGHDAAVFWSGEKSILEHAGLY